MRNDHLIQTSLLVNLKIFLLWLKKKDKPRSFDLNLSQIKALIKAYSINDVIDLLIYIESEINYKFKATIEKSVLKELLKKDYSRMYLSLIHI